MSAAETVAVDETDRIRDVLTPVVRDALGDRAADIVGVERLSGGASRETWILEVPSISAGRLVLRCDPPALVRDLGMGLEARSIEVAAGAGVPVPAVVAWSAEGHPLGRPYLITHFVEGQSLPRRILTVPELDRARQTLAADCGRALARLHAADPGRIEDLAPMDPIAAQRERLDELDDAHPVLELGLSWLAARRPEPIPSTIVHGDFRTGNLIVGPDGLRAVLDWEVVHLGDPYEDLGWLCVRQWRFRGGEPVGGFGTFGQLAEAYEAEIGRALDRARWRWWLVYGTVRWGVSCNMQAAKHLTGQQRSVDLVAIGRRACENELDLLDLIDHAEATR